MADSKLLKARALIEIILKDLDIAGCVFLHNAPGQTEVLLRLDPSYSKVAGVPPLVHLVSRLADYHGDADAQRRDLEATANMVRSLGDTMAATTISLLELADVIDAKTGAEHTPLRPDPEEH